MNSPSRGPAQAIRPLVLVYRRNLLPFSETFILRQVRSLARWRGVLAGQPLADGLSLDGAEFVPIALPDSWANPLRPSVAERALGFLRWRREPPSSPHFRRALSDAKAIRRASWFASLKSQDPRLVHAHFGPDGLEAWPLALALDVPLLVTFHGYDVSTRPAYWRSGHMGQRRVLYPDALHEMSLNGVRFVAVSETIKDMAAEYGIERDVIRKIMIGIDTKAVQPGAVPIVQRPKRILFVGRFVEKKGVPYLIEAFAEVKRMVPDAELRLVGEGRDEEALRALAKDSDVQFAGRLSPEAVLHEMRHARVLCAPSIRAERGDAEGIPTVIVEAQACGLPVVTSAPDGAAEGILDGTSGIGFPAQDHQALIAALVKCLTDDDFATQASVAARRFAEERLDIARHSSLLELYYDEIVAASRSAASAPDIASVAASGMSARAPRTLFAV